VSNNKLNKDVKLLGSLLSSDVENLVLFRIGKANSSFYALNDKIWNTNINNKLKIRIFMTVCVSSLLYGLSTLPLSDINLKELDFFAFKKLKMILKLYWNENDEHHMSYKSLESIIKDFGIKKFIWPSEMLRKRRKIDFWHHFRHHQEYNNLWFDQGFEHLKLFKKDDNAKKLVQKSCIEQIVWKYDMKLSDPAKLVTLSILPELSRQYQYDPEIVPEAIKKCIKEEKIIRLGIKVKKLEDSFAFSTSKLEFIRGEMIKLKQNCNALILLGFEEKVKEENIKLTREWNMHLNNLKTLSSAKVTYPVQYTFNTVKS
jgi:hypothetical protein